MANQISILRQIINVYVDMIADGPVLAPDSMALVN
jgi:hypothetical protein